jgi:hypothetical protein
MLYYAHTLRPTEHLTLRSKRRRNLSRSQSPTQPSPARVSFEPSWNTKQGGIPTQEDCRGCFFDDYRKVAEKHDKEFLMKRGEDLNTTLIFVSSTWVLNASR